jgi:hypothetical protein
MDMTTIYMYGEEYSMNPTKHDWLVVAVSTLDITCECKKEFQVRSKNLKGAITKAEKEIDDSWSIRALWWLDPARTDKQD